MQFRKTDSHYIFTLLLQVIKSRNMKQIATIALLFLSLAALARLPEKCYRDTVQYPEETHLRNIRQLTFGGDNAEAYWSFDGRSLVFQRTLAKEGIPCDQIFYGSLPVEGEAFVYKRISNGKG